LKTHYWEEQNPTRTGICSIYSSHPSGDAFKEGLRENKLLAFKWILYSRDGALLLAILLTQCLDT
jgi:hypothetical protein